MGGGAQFVYVLDPDGHRIELFNTHYQTIDVEPALGWNLSDPRRTAFRLTGARALVRRGLSIFWREGAGAKAQSRPTNIGTLSLTSRRMRSIAEQKQ